jgi:Lrp/AsnC family leucine-responsive transcriptional regulator
MDSIDFRLLEELQLDARLSYAELGRRVGLSTPAAADRIRKMEDGGVISGYHAHVCPEEIGLLMRAFVKVGVAGEQLGRFATLVTKIPEVLECHRVTGAESYILYVAVAHAAHLEAVIDSLMPYVSTNTSIVLASPVTWSALRPPAQFINPQRK